MARKKKDSGEEPGEFKGTTKTATSGIKARLDETDNSKSYRPNETDQATIDYVVRRSGEMINFRKSLGIQKLWRQADEEYVPHELTLGTNRKRFETNQNTGLRSTLVPVGDTSQNWREFGSAPTLLVKIQTALSLIIDQQPEADLVPELKKHAATSDLAYALWKRNWQITNAKEKLKLFVFNLIKYGWAPSRIYPRLVKYNKRVLTEVDTENPENNKYDDRENIWFNDVDREPLDPFHTWIDEMAKPYDPLSMNECYYEIDYSYDQAEIEFGQYPAWKYVPRNSQLIRNDDKNNTNSNNVTGATETAAEGKKRNDIVTFGFFESRLKDLFVIYVPKHKIVLYQSPLPNDDGYLSITHAPWILRNSRLPYGISLWEIIRQNKAIYDKWNNMGTDQLTLSIMKFGFHAGTNPNLGDGKITIEPGVSRQVTSSDGKPGVNWMEIPGPGADFWKGIEMQSAKMDDDSGISPTLEGEITGKTLGEIAHAKEASLKRLKVPVENIAWHIEQEAYVALSWMSQIYPIPTIKKFTDVAEMMAFEQEEQIEHHELFQTEEGEEVGLQATYLPQLALHLEDREGKMVKSNKSQFLQLGKDIQPHELRWRGIFKVIPRSIIDSSQEFIKASKTELFNMLVPILQFPPQLFAKSVNQILKVHEEDPKDWVPDSWIQFLEGGGPQMPMPGMSPQGQDPMAQMMQGLPEQGGGTMQNQAGMTPNQGMQTVVPQGDISTISPQQMGTGSIFTKRA